MRTGQNTAQNMHALLRCAGFAADPVNGRFHVRSRQPAGQTSAVEQFIEGFIGVFKTEAYGAKVIAIGVQHSRDSVRDLRSFPRRPEPISEKRDSASIYGIQSSRNHY